MRRIAIALTLLAGCFGEPDTVDKIVGTTATMTSAEPAESSSSSDGESSSSEGDASESSSTGDSPYVCPDWCNNGCDLLFGIYEMCQCTSDLDCHEDTHCDRPDEAIGHCR